jgi:hypothetical protein
LAPIDASAQFQRRSTPGIGCEQFRTVRVFRREQPGCPKPIDDEDGEEQVRNPRRDRQVKPAFGPSAGGAEVDT